MPVRIISQSEKEITTETTEIIAEEEEITVEEEEVIRETTEDRVKTIAKSVNTDLSILKRTKLQKKRKRITKTALILNPKFVISEMKKSNNLRMKDSFLLENPNLRLATQENKDKLTTNNMVKNTTTHHHNNNKTNDQIHKSMNKKIMEII